jgi:hypothetical protein
MQGSIQKAMVENFKGFFSIEKKIHQDDSEVINEDFAFYKEI